MSVLTSGLALGTEARTSGGFVAMGLPTGDDRGHALTTAAARKLVAAPRFEVNRGLGAGNEDAFVAKLDPAGAAVTYSSLLGGSDGDTGFAIAVDGNANAYLVGQANHYASPPGNFPTTPGAFQERAPGGSEVFVTKIASAPIAPLVTSLRSRSGPATGGTEVTITGTGLGGALRRHAGPQLHR